jgi:hypothetical protein
MTEAAGRSARVSERTVFHGRKYTRGAADQTFPSPEGDDAHIAIGNYGRKTGANPSTRPGRSGAIPDAPWAFTDMSRGVHGERRGKKLRIALRMVSRVGYDWRGFGSPKPPRGGNESTVPERSGCGAAAAGEAGAVLDRKDSGLFCLGIRHASGGAQRCGPRSRLFSCRPRLGEYILVATSAGFQTAMGIEIVWGGL